MSGNETKRKCEKTLERAEQIRQFEIGLYWKRSAYFWTFVALAFAGYGALQVQATESEKKNLGFLLANVGFVASAAWFLVNRGSKYWQEYWETQVDRLERGATGPLYTVVIARVDEEKAPRLERLTAWWRRPRSLKAWWRRRSLKQWMTGAPRLPESEKNHVKSLSVPSVSRINQLGSLYVAGVWIILGVRSLLKPECCNKLAIRVTEGVSTKLVLLINAIGCYSLAMFGLSVAALVAFYWLGKSKLGDYYYSEDCREAINLIPWVHATADCRQKPSPLNDRGEMKA